MLFFTPLLLLNYFLFNLFLFLQKVGGGGGAKAPPAPPSARSLQRTILTLPLGTHVVRALAMLEIKRHSEKSQTKETVFFKCLSCPSASLLSDAAVCY